jgi:hypothetical protein
VGITAFGSRFAGAFTAAFVVLPEVFCAATVLLPFEAEIVTLVFFFGCAFLTVRFLTALTTFLAVAVGFLATVFLATGFLVVFFFFVSAIRSSFI